MFKSNPLARRLTAIVLVISTAVAIIATAVQVLINYHQELNTLNARMDNMRIIEVPELSNSIWHFDEEQIQLQLIGMLNIQHISYVEVLVYGGENYSTGVKPSDKNARVKEIDLYYEQEGERFDVGKLIVVADISSVWSRVNRWLFLTIILSLIQTLLLAGIFLFVVVRIITRPISEIVSYTEEMNLDRLDQPLSLKPRRFSPPGDELELVVSKLNDMRIRLKENIARRLETEEALRQSESNYREIFNATSDGIIIRKISDGTIVKINDAILQIYGYDSKDELVNTKISNLSSDNEKYSDEAAEQMIQTALQQGPQIFEWLAKKKNGETFWIEVSLRATSIAGKDYILAVIRDISERKKAEELLVSQNEALIDQSLALEEAQEKTKQLNEELEQRVYERTVQLEALNQEMEAFSYSVAHDLRAPLRHIAGFSQVILDEHGKLLNDQVVEWLNKIQNSARNLYEMVEALLSLSKVTRDSIHIMRINLSNVVERITDHIRSENQERVVNVKIEKDVYVFADMRLLNVMVENLLENAWKFTANNKNAEIEFGTFEPRETTLPKMECTCFYIKDNGVGFDMGYIDRLFGPFQRLHSASDFSGTGIGLATVKRIVQRHGGRVWAEADVDQGAVFFFCFPQSKIPFDTAEIS